FKRRYDKMYANAGEVLDGIVDILNSSDDVDVTLGKRITAYTFLVRDYLYAVTENMSTAK
ncbi:hypothetical protein HDU98_001478, partial [Podochytrium sp. JEL0797]